MLSEASFPGRRGLPYLEVLGPGDEVGKVEVLDVVASDHVGVYGADEGRPGLVGGGGTCRVTLLVPPAPGMFWKPPRAVLVSSRSW